MNTREQDIYLNTLFAKIPPICGKYLFKLPRTEKDIQVIDKGRKYFQQVREGLNFLKDYQENGIDSIPLYSLEALIKAYSVFEDDKNIDDQIETIEMTLNALKDDNRINQEAVKQTSRFFTRFSSKMRCYSIN